MRLSAQGILVELPGGWDGRIEGRPGAERAQAFGARLSAISPAPEARVATLQVANFALPLQDGEFGTRATAAMPSHGAFAALVEYLPDSGLIPGRGLFAARAVPLPLRRSQFSPDTLLVARPGQEGSQHFFTVGERPFCLYAVLGSSARAASLVAELNGTLASLRISAAPQ